MWGFYPNPVKHGESASFEAILIPDKRKTYGDSNTVEELKENRIG